MPSSRRVEKATHHSVAFLRAPTAGIDAYVATDRQKRGEKEAPRARRADASPRGRE